MTYDVLERYEAYKAVARAKRRGELVVGECAHGPDCRGRIEAHHEDYSKPLDVVWLCQTHHRALHEKRWWRSGRRVA